MPVDVLGFRIAFALAFGVIMIFALEALPLDHLPQLSHEKLEVYQKSIAPLALYTKVLSTVRRGHAELFDELKRAALSVPLNTAEARGRTASLDNAKLFSIAKGKALALLQRQPHYRTTQ